MSGTLVSPGTAARSVSMRRSAMLPRRSFLLRSAVLGAATGLARVPRVVGAADAERTFTFGYDQPRETAYSFLADAFETKLGELSGGKLKIRQFPGAALGQEPEMAQKGRAGDLDFAINAPANTSPIVPQAGLFSLHFIFRDEAHLERCLDANAITD